MAGDAALTAVLKRDRVVVLAALLLLAVLAWAYVLWLAARMYAPSPDMPSMNMAQMTAMMSPGFAPWTPAHALFIFAMWSVMMIGMMTPSAAPMILIYTQVARQANTLGKPFASAAWFAFCYLAAWMLFAAFATGAQYVLERAALLSPMMAGTSRIFGGAVLIAAGLYQWTPLKHACLVQCRSPLAFIQRHGGFRSSGPGSLRLGLVHGINCIGCCWALMALLFVGGVMNPLWIAGLTIFVLAEKLLPGARYISGLAGALAFGAGIWLIFGM